MKHTTLKKSAILAAIITAQVMAIPLKASAQSTGFAVTPIVKRGDPVSDGGRFFDCKECIGGVQGLHALNNRNDVSIAADVISGKCFTNIFLISEGESIRLADFCQVTEFGKLTFLGAANINDRGEAAINAGVTVNNRIVEMLLLYSGGQLTKIVQEEDTTPVGTIFKGCGFGQPAINNKGEVAFHACAETVEGPINDGVFVYSGGVGRKVVLDGEPSPLGGQFVINVVPAQPVHMNDKGDILFSASVILDPVTQKHGLFLATNEGFKKVELDGDPMPGGGIVTRRSVGNGDLNNKGEVTFSVNLSEGEADSGIFLYSGGQIAKIMAEGDPSPIGGRFSSLVDPQLREDFPTPRINENGTMAFKVRVTGGSAPSAIFLASPTAIVKVAAVGDPLPTGGKVKDITSFALNDFGQVAFYAEVKNGPKGVFLAAPLPPAIAKVKLKDKGGRLELRVNGSALITNDSVIEVNGVALTQTDYPAAFRQDGGTTRRVVSRDSRLGELLPAGRAVQVTVYNPLTNLRSAPVMFTR